MQVTSFSCPHCSAVLRIRDQKLVGRNVDCPDCKKPFEIAAIDDSSRQEPAVVTKLVDASQTPNTKKTVRADIDNDPGNQTQDRSVDQSTDKAARYRPAEFESFEEAPETGSSWMTPQRIGWCVASVIALTVLIAISLSPDDSSPIESDDKSETIATTPSSPPDNAVDEGVPEKETATVEALPAGASRVDQQLTRIGKHILDFAAKNEALPSVQDNGLPNGKQLSWLSQIAFQIQTNKRIQPQWDRPWDAPLNDRFVRQKFVEFHNPALSTLTSDTGYPATHFVGISGVGSDAAKLPANHPRAGVFGHARKTSLNEIPDGQANTMLLAGVVNHFGSWAASGNATTRSLTKEPYINGPDGLGTGQKDGMYVLLSDGTVRFVAANTSPTILRRMASANDGFPLDPKIPGEPGDSPPSETVEIAKKDDSPPPEKPLPAPEDAQEKEPDKVAAVQPEPAKKPVIQEKPIDVAMQLEQPIAIFELREATSVRVLLLQIEEMAGVPVNYDEQNLEEKLDTELTLKLKSTTVGAILTETLKPAGLTFKIVDGMLNVIASSS